MGAVLKQISCHCGPQRSNYSAPWLRPFFSDWSLAYLRIITSIDSGSNWLQKYLIQKIFASIIFDLKIFVSEILDLEIFASEIFDLEIFASKIFDLKIFASKIFVLEIFDLKIFASKIFDLRSIRHVKSR